MIRLVGAVGRLRQSNIQLAIVANVTLVRQRLNCDYTVQVLQQVCRLMGMRGKSPYPPMARCGRIKAIRSYAHGPIFISLNCIFISFLII